MPMHAARVTRWLALTGLILLAAAASADIRVLEEGDSSRVEVGRGEGTSRIRILVETDDDTTESSIEFPRRPRRPSSVRRGDDGGDIVRFGENIEIRPDELVEGGVVAIGADIVVWGHVLDDVVSIGGDVRIESGAVVEGNTVAIGGRVDRSPGSTVLDGDVSIPLFLPGLRSDWIGPGLRLGLVFAALLFLFLAGGFFDLLVPDRLQRIELYVQNRVWGSFFAGVAAEVLFLPVFLLLCVTVLGIPIALLLPFAYATGLLLGYVAVALVMGSRLGARDLANRGGRMMAFAIGVAVLVGVYLLGEALGAVGGPVAWLGPAITVFATVANWTVATVGLGSVLLSRLGVRTGDEARPRDPVSTYGAPLPPSPSQI